MKKPPSYLRPPPNEYVRYLSKGCGWMGEGPTHAESIPDDFECPLRVEGECKMGGPDDCHGTLVVTGFPFYTCDGPWTYPGGYPQIMHGFDLTTGEFHGDIFADSRWYNKLLIRMERTVNYYGDFFGIRGSNQRGEDARQASEIGGWIWRAFYGWTLTVTGDYDRPENLDHTAIIFSINALTRALEEGKRIFDEDAVLGQCETVAEIFAKESSPEPYPYPKTIDAWTAFIYIRQLSRANLFEMLYLPREYRPPQRTLDGVRFEKKRRTRKEPSGSKITQGKLAFNG